MDYSLDLINKVPLTLNQEFVDLISGITTLDFEITHIKLKDIIPYELFKLDCSKKVELKEIIEILSKRFKKNENYIIFKVDIALYMSLCKIIYNKENSMSLLPFIPVLETFHIYKIGLETIWCTYFFQFWIPITQVLYPESTMIKKPKLQLLTGFFKVLYHAFDKIKEEVRSYLEDNKNHRNWNILATFYHLLDQTIPKFFHFYLSTKMNNFYYFFHHLKLVYLEVSFNG